MPDKILTCQNCHSTFVYSDYEISLDAKINKPEPIYCPICTSIKSQEERRPAKPPKN